MKKIKLSRGPEIDVQQCINNSVGNRFDMIVVAAQRAREISKQNKLEKNFSAPSSIVSALLEIQNSKND